MSIKVPNQTREIIPSGNHVGRCVSMVHIGTVPTSYGNESKLVNKVLLTWELPNMVYEYEDKELTSVISKEYTLTMGSKGNLRKDLESWRGKAFTEAEADDFDLTKLLGVPCMLNVIHTTSKTTGNTYANISNVSRMPEGLECPPQSRETFEFNYDAKFSTEIVDNLPDFIRKKVKMSQEFMAKIGLSVDPQSVETPPIEGQAPPEESANDLPF